ncbi:MAG: PAS domain S-box protein [Planctomycetes bacterium]|nr:PAS domain S-box protein [Planctomycetota bacterium]MBL7142858.1 PAS domain S-box protein [Phycisphaerae bacterium]
MDDTRYKILLIEDDRFDQMAFERFLKDEKPLYECKIASSVSQAHNILACEDFDAIVSDYSLGDGTALNILDFTKDIPIIIVTGVGDEEVATQAWRRGAYDYITKDIKRNYLKAIPKTIKNAVEHKKMEEALERKKRNLEAIFDAAPGSMLLIDENMIVTRANDTIKQLVQKEYHHIINHKLGNVLGCINSTCNENACRNSQLCQECPLYKTLKSVLDSGKPVHDVEAHITLKINEKKITLWLRVSAKPVIMDGCKHVVVVIDDITEHKKMESEHRLAEEKYRLIFENSAVAITMADEQNKLISWNKFAEDLLGMDREDLFLRQVSSLYPPDAWGKIKACNVKQKGLQHHLIETTMIRKDGSIIDVDVSLSVFKNPEDERINSIAIIRDMTERRKAEEKLKETMEIKSQFISTVSHELRTPLAAIKEGIAIVLDEVVGRINEKQKKFLNIAKRNVDRLGNMINNILDFQKLEAENIGLHIQNNDIKQIALEVHETMVLYAEKNGIELMYEFAEDIPQAKFDRERIVQVLINLIGNAIKFSPKGGQACLNVRHRNEELVISVSDTGFGIPKYELPKIFERFYRAKHQREEVQGTGLGLSIVHKIVTRHGGRIEVESEVGRGSTFTVFLPLDPKTSQNLLPVTADHIL